MSKGASHRKSEKVDGGLESSIKRDDLKGVLNIYTWDGSNEMTHLRDEVPGAGRLELHGDGEDGEDASDKEEGLAPAGRRPVPPTGLRREAAVEHHQLVDDAHRTIALAEDGPAPVRVAQHVAQQSHDLHNKVAPLTSTHPQQLPKNCFSPGCRTGAMHHDGMPTIFILLKTL